MNIITIIKEEVARWYHGTPDVRGLEGGFEPRMGNTSYISDPQKWDEMQVQMDQARASGDEETYHELLKKRSPLHKNMSYKKPIYFTKNHSVARTYADPWRSTDYQGAQPSVLNAEIDDSGKILKIHAMGESFRGIKTEIVKDALMKDGVPENVIDNYFASFQNWINDGKMSSETLGIIAQQLGYDIIDVLGVKDNYRGKGPSSTVRMVFDPQRIKVV